MWVCVGEREGGGGWGGVCMCVHTHMQVEGMQINEHLCVKQKPDS